VLKAYSFINDRVKYTQGMNFIAAMILLYVEDEMLAWFIFTKILDKDEWRNLYLFETPKLFQVTDNLKEFIKKELPLLFKSIQKFDIYLESLFASAFMTLFSNLISIENATKVLDRFILCNNKLTLMEFSG
jgi:hypothetical protein